MKKVSLVLRLVIAILLGLGLGYLRIDFITTSLSTFNSIFNNLLSFLIPLIILSFIASGISSLGEGVGKIICLAVLFAYLSTVFAGLVAYTVNANLFAHILSTESLTIISQNNPEEALLPPYFTIALPPLMPVISSLVLAFILGVGAVVCKTTHLAALINDLKDIISRLIGRVIIPLLPLHICGVVANMTHAGQIGHLMQVFIKIFALIIAMHMLLLILQYTIAGILTKQNPLALIRNMVPSYLAALGTQSSAATIPVNLERTRLNGVSEQICNFTIPLFATIHLAGSTITITSCAMAIMYLSGMPLTLTAILPFILMLGVSMVAAPGIPGGAVMASLGLLHSMLGFNELAISLMIALYITQDSFGTACNVTGDGALAIFVDCFNKKHAQGKLV